MLNAKRITRLRLFYYYFRVKIIQIGRGKFVGLEKDVIELTPRILTAEGLLRFIDNVILPDVADHRMTQFAIYSAEADPFFDAIANDAIRNQDKKHRVHSFSSAFLKHIAKLPATCAVSVTLIEIVKKLRTDANGRTLTRLLRMKEAFLRTHTHASVAIVIGSVISAIHPSADSAQIRSSQIDRLARFMSNVRMKPDEDFHNFLKLLLNSVNIVEEYIDPKSNLGIHNITLTEHQRQNEYIISDEIAEHTIHLAILIEAGIHEESLVKRMAALLHYESVATEKYGEIPIAMLFGKDDERFEVFLKHFFGKISKIPENELLMTEYRKPNKSFHVIAQRLTQTTIHPE